MAWERRQRGGSYYYKSVRIDGQPRKIYVGAGPEAESCAQLAAQKRQQEQENRERLQAEQQHVAPAELALEELRELATLLTRAVLLLGGCHEHRGQWRRRRHGRDHD